jgi:hypothetical protein
MNRTIRPNPDVVYQELEDEIVLVHLHTNRIFSLNATGARLWKLLDAGHDRDEIHAQMTREYTVDADVLAGEIDRLLAGLKAAGLILDDDR